MTDVSTLIKKVVAMLVLAVLVVALVLGIGCTATDSKKIADEKLTEALDEIYGAGAVTEDGGHIEYCSYERMRERLIYNGFSVAETEDLILYEGLEYRGKKIVSCYLYALNVPYLESENELKAKEGYRRSMFVAVLLLNDGEWTVTRLF